MNTLERMKMSQLQKSSCEELHRQLMRVHKDVAWGAAKRIEAALEVLHKIERSNIDLRDEAKARIAKFETLRAQTEKLWQDASKLRCDLIHEDGCDTSCEEHHTRLHGRRHIEG